MKTKCNTFRSIFAMIALILLATCWSDASAQKKSQLLKIGTYDSRIVTMAYSRSAMFDEQQVKMGKEGAIIEQSDDTLKKTEAFYKILTYQYLLHQQVFSRGSNYAILELVKDKLPQVAKA
ncbi:MAG: hypothetical protein U1C46_03455, partial [Bacteroidales bacterium]|nr:hypothetical protein [Bacteroidales bacterium]